MTAVALARAAAPAPMEDGSVEILLGQTAYMQLASSAPTGEPSRILRVPDPHRDYEVIKVSFVADAAGAANVLQVRNGYDVPVSLAMNEACGATPGAHLMVDMPAGADGKLRLPSSTTRVVLCKFTVAAPPPRGAGAAARSTQ